MLLDHLPAINLNMFTHLLTNKENSISIYDLELLITYIPSIDLTLPFYNIKSQSINFLWKHFMKNFNANDFTQSPLHLSLQLTPSHQTLIHKLIDLYYN